MNRSLRGGARTRRGSPVHITARNHLRLRLATLQYDARIRGMLSKLDRLIVLSTRMQTLIDSLLYFSRVGRVELSVEEREQYEASRAQYRGFVEAQGIRMGSSSTTSTKKTYVSGMTIKPELRGASSLLTLPLICV